MAFNGTGANVTTLNASNISSGTVATARLGSGTADNTTFLRGDSTYATVSGATGLNMQMFTSSGTFNVPAGITKVKVTVIGAGGNGGNGTSGWSGGGGGGAGGYFLDYVSVTPGGTATVTVGTNAGTRTSSFAGSSTITATGGANGTNAFAYGNSSPVYKGADAPASVFGISYYNGGITRETVNTRFYVGSTGMDTASNSLVSTFGGCYLHGYGAAGARRQPSPAAIHTALGHGAGGGAGSSADTGGGLGTNGLVIVEW